MYHLTAAPDPEQSGILAQVKQLALHEWSSDNPDAVVGEVWVGDQQEVGRYEGAAAIWLVWVYPTPGHLQVYRVWLDLQAEMGKMFRGPYEANRYADLHGGVHYHYSLVGQFADGLHILENCPDKAKEPKQPGWMRHTSYTLEKLRAQLSDLTRFLSHNEESTPDWQQARQQVLEMYTNLNALEVLCRQQGKLDDYATATTMRVIPCAFPVPDENGAGVVWMRTELSQYGLYVVIHKQRPGAYPQPGEGMAALHVDYRMGAGKLSCFNRGMRAPILVSGTDRWAGERTWLLPFPLFSVSVRREEQNRQQEIQARGNAQPHADQRVQARWHRTAISCYRGGHSHHPVHPQQMLAEVDG